MIGCVWAGAAAGVNLAGVVLLAYLWHQGNQELRAIEKAWRLAEAAQEAKRAEHGNGL